MPSPDHFRPPARIRAPWESLATIWSGKAMAHLNRFGAVVPTVPLALKYVPLVPIDLEGSYCAALADHNL